MRRMLLFNPKFEKEAIEAWGIKVDAERAIVGSKSDGELLDEVADEHPEWFILDRYDEPENIIKQMCDPGSKILIIEPKDEDEQNS